MSEQNGIRGTARVFVLLAWASALALAAWLFQLRLEADRNPNRELRPLAAGEAVLRRNRQGHYVAPGAINGHPVVFLVDTGATRVALSEALARRIGLRLRPGGMVETANGRVPAHRTRLDSVRLGGIELRDVPAVVLPSLAADDEVLLGMSFLGRLELVQQDGRLLLRQR